MNDADVKELFGAMAAGGPADRLDVDRAIAAGRRRRRTRTTASLVSVAAVLAFMVAFVAVGIPREDSAPPVGPTVTSTPTGSASPSRTPTPTPSDDDWSTAIQVSLPYGDQLTISSLVFVAMHPDAPSSPKDRPGDTATTAFHYSEAGRTTGLVVHAFAPGMYGPTSAPAREILLASCAGGDGSCDDMRDTALGPVLVSHGTTSVSMSDVVQKQAGTVSFVSARSLRPSGVLVVVTSYNGDTDRYGRVLAGSGAVGMADDVDRLVSTATGIPVPPLALAPPSSGFWPPAPVASPTAASRLIVVRPAVAHALGYGATMTVTAPQVCVSVPGGSGPTCQADGGLGERDVSRDVVPIDGGSRGYLVFGRYSPMNDTGGASVMVTVGGRSRLATLVSAGAGVSYLTYYVVLPAHPVAPSPTVEVFHGGDLVAQYLGG